MNRYIATGLCISHLQAISALARREMLLLQKPYAVKLADHGGLEIHEVEKIDDKNDFYRLGQQVEVELTINDLCVSVCLYEVEKFYKDQQAYIEQHGDPRELYD